jgi:hypothetical protein
MLAEWRAREREGGMVCMIIDMRAGQGRTREIDIEEQGGGGEG